MRMLSKLVGPLDSSPVNDVSSTWLTSNEIHLVPGYKGNSDPSGCTLQWGISAGMEQSYARLWTVKRALVDGSSASGRTDSEIVRKLTKWTLHGNGWFMKRTILLERSSSATRSIGSDGSITNEVAGYCSWLERIVDSKLGCSRTLDFIWNEFTWNYCIFLNQNGMIADFLIICFW